MGHAARNHHERKQALDLKSPKSKTSCFCFCCFSGFPCPATITLARASQPTDQPASHGCSQLGRRPARPPWIPWLLPAPLLLCPPGRRPAVRARTTRCCTRASPSPCWRPDHHQPQESCWPPSPAACTYALPHNTSNAPMMMSKNTSSHLLQYSSSASHRAPAALRRLRRAPSRPRRRRLSSCVTSPMAGEHAIHTRSSSWAGKPPRCSSGCRTLVRACNERVQRPPPAALLSCACSHPALVAGVPCTEACESWCDFGADLGTCTSVVRSVTILDECAQRLRTLAARERPGECIQGLELAMHAAELAIVAALEEGHRADQAFHGHMWLAPPQNCSVGVLALRYKQLAGREPAVSTLESVHID
jgi:hypothetical protein